MPSQRIKDALPKEIVDRIKASSQRSRTIAIIEPVNRSEENSSAESVGEKNKPISEDKNSNQKRSLNIKTEQSILNSSHQSILATRFGCYKFR